MYNVPVLFIIFANPHTTKQVFERIRQVKPTKLYVACDAPRNGRAGEDECCIATRAIIDSVDWDCEVKTFYREKNVGPKIAVSEAITWFFEQEEYGIIFEHDCLPDPSFFPFCEDLLIRYKDDDRIGHIGGNCFIPGIVKNGLSYDFCSITHIWGWATWRRVWKNYDVNFSFWNEHKESRSFLFCNKREEIYFSSFIPDVLKNKNGINTWDTQYYYMLRLQNQLSVYPTVNLVANIGLGDPNAVHTSKSSKKLSVPSSPMQFPLKHPQYILRNKELDEAAVKHNFFSWKRLARFYLKIYQHK